MSKQQVFRQQKLTADPAPPQIKAQMESDSDGIPEPPSPGTQLVTTPITERTPSMAVVLQNREFLKLWLAQIVSQTAQQIVNIALMLQVRQITGSNTAVGGVIISFTIPAILFAAIAGVFVERNSKRTMLVITNVARGLMVLAFIIPSRSLGAGAGLPIIYVVILLFSAVSQFFSPAEASKIPLVVKKEELVAANSLFNLTLTGTQLGGFVLIGPLLIKTVFRDNYAGLYILICVLCLVAAVVTYFLPKDQPAERASELMHRAGKNGDGTYLVHGKMHQVTTALASAWEELVEGWSFIRKDKVVGRAIIYWSITIAVFMMLGTVGPGFLERVIGLPSDNLIYILLPGGIGLVIGVLIVGRISTPGTRDLVINQSLFGAGALLAVFALVEPITNLIFHFTVGGTGPGWLILGIMALLTLVLGAFNSFISVLAQTSLQERPPEEIRARVFSAFYTISNAILLVPVFFAGAMSDALGDIPTVLVIAVSVVLIAGYGLYRNQLRRTTTEPLSMGEVTQQEAEAALAVGSPGANPLPAEAQQKITMLRRLKKR